MARKPIDKVGKTWAEKLARTGAGELPKVCEMEGRNLKRYGKGKMVIPSPAEVEALMRAVPRGKVSTVAAMQAALCAKHRAQVACPMATGVFAWIVAHAADEAERDGKKRLTPYWRMLKANGEINSKYPGGVAGVARRLRAEGQKVVRRGERMFVEGWEERSVGSVAGVVGDNLRRGTRRMTPSSIA